MSTMPYNLCAQGYALMEMNFAKWEPLKLVGEFIFPHLDELTPFDSTGRV